MISGKIKNPSLFAKIQLLIQAQISHRHALVLYEFFIDCLSRQRVDNMVINGVPLSQLLELTGLNETAYADKGSFKTFNRDVLKKSLKDINEHTDLHVDVKPIRKGRRVVAFDFHVQRNKAYQVMLELDVAAPVSDAVEGQGEEATPSTSSGLAEFTALLQLMMARGISELQAKKLIADYPNERIQANVALVDAEMDKGRIKRQGAYLVTAIKDDYANSLAAAQPDTSATQKSSHPKKTRDADDANYREAWHRELGKRALAAFTELPVKKQKTLQSTYLNSQRSSTAAAAYDKGGFEHVLVQVDFSERFLAPRLLKGKSALTLAAYAKQCRDAERAEKKKRRAEKVKTAVVTAPNRRDAPGLRHPRTSPPL